MAGCSDNHMLPILVAGPLLLQHGDNIGKSKPALFKKNAAD
jgi:hypothetical protein